MEHVSATPDLSHYKRHGRLRDKIDAAAVTGEVLYLSPTTGKPVKRVRKGQKVLFGYKDHKGDVHTLHPHAQTRDERLRRWLEKHIQKSGDKAFALYEQRGRELLRDPITKKPIKTKTGMNRRTSKLAIPSTTRQQRAVLYKRGKRVRNIEFSYTRHSKEQLLTRLVVTPIRPTGKVIEMNLMGETIIDSLRQIVLDKSWKNLKKYHRVFYSYVLIYRDPETGEKVTVPGHGADLPRGGRVEFSRQGGPLGTVYFKQKVSRLQNLSVQLGHEIRGALAHQGLRFTSLFKMNQLINQYSGAVDRAERRGDEERAGKIQRILDRIKRPYQMGPMPSDLTPVFLEDEVGHRIPTQLDKERVRIRVRFTIEEDPALRRAAEAKNKKAREKRKKTYKGKRRV